MYLILGFLGFLLIVIVYILHDIKKKKISKCSVVKNIKFGLFKKNDYYKLK
jgi:hypothetical protein